MDSAYIDPSVILRLLLREADPFEEWGNWKVAVSSEIAKVEVWRNVHRLHVLKVLSDEEFKNLSDATAWLLAQIDFVPFNSAVLRRSAGSFGKVIGALDAIHLSTALLWRDTKSEDITFVTHDRQLGRAARAHGFKVLPISKL
jgi:predicted nucleic acid-binding protein